MNNIVRWIIVYVVTFLCPFQTSCLCPVLGHCHLSGHSLLLAPEQKLRTRPLPFRVSQYSSTVPRYGHLCGHKCSSLFSHASQRSSQQWRVPHFPLSAMLLILKNAHVLGKMYVFRVSETVTDRILHNVISNDCVT